MLTASWDSVRMSNFTSSATAVRAAVRSPLTRVIVVYEDVCLERRMGTRVRKVTRPVVARRAV